MQGIQQLLNQINGNPYLATAIFVWTLAWKGLALWKAGQKKNKIWFIVLLVLNTFGIVEILYYFIFSKREKSKV